jgi:hypothetical protein
MSDESVSGSFAEFLARGDNAAEFYKAFVAAYKKMHGSTKGGPYNIDSVGYMATAIECYYYAREHMEGKPRFANRLELLKFAVSQMTVEGLILEFGVFSGNTINLIADQLPDKKIFGFDSFKGLPETWTPGTQAGHFARETLPAVRKNVDLVVGWFDRTLPTFLDAHPERVALLHIDCDLYSSTQTVLIQLSDRIVPGTIIVFDEYFNYVAGWRRHEFQAFQEFVKYRRLKYEYIGLVPNKQQVAVRILP